VSHIGNINHGVSNNIIIPAKTPMHPSRTRYLNPHVSLMYLLQHHVFKKFFRLIHTPSLPTPMNPLPSPSPSFFPSIAPALSLFSPFFPDLFFVRYLSCSGITKASPSVRGALPFFAFLVPTPPKNFLNPFLFSTGEAAATIGGGTPFGPTRGLRREAIARPPGLGGAGEEGNMLKEPECSFVGPSLSRMI